jgi:leader peptidase (prepilin peptidase)/N-methyltransferase
VLEQLIYTLQNFDLAIGYVEQTYPVLIFMLYFAFAASIGSFLGCCYYRIPRRISLLNPKTSFCPNCNTKLTALDLFPILSYMVLRGKCRHCSVKIAPTYFIIEILTVITILGILYYDKF